MTRKSLRRKNEQGGTLVLVLGFVALVGMLSIPYLNQARANVYYNEVATRVVKRVTGVNGGLDVGIQNLRKTPGMCGTTSSPLQTLVYDGIQVSVTCESVGASPWAGAAAWAAFITGSSPGGGITANSAATTKRISGSVYNGPRNWVLANNPNSMLEVAGGDIVQPTAPAAPLCPTTIANLTFPTVPYGFRCVSAAIPTPAATQTLPAWPPVVPASTFPMATPPVGGCYVYSPGVYGPTANPQFQSNRPSYLRPGVYVFQGLNNLNFANQRLIGGRPPTAAQDPGVCTAEASTDPRNGVVIILAGSTTLTLNNQSNVELFGWRANPAGAADPVGLSVYQDITSTVTGTILQDGNGAQPVLSVHGNVYVPRAGVVLSDTNQSTAKLRAGVVASAISVSTTGSAATTPAISQAGITAAGSTTFKLTATAVPAVPEFPRNQTTPEKPVSATAQVSITNDAARTPTIDSWVVSNP